MKRVCAVLFALFLLCGCQNQSENLNRAMTIRSKILSSAGCSFDAEITADYGNSVCTFTLQCQVSDNADLYFTVIAPETIFGITGSVSQQGGKLTFDNEVLAFDMLLDGQFAPVCAPWLMIHTLRSGYISDCGMDADNLRIGIDDSYKENPLRCDVWVNTDNIPVRAEVLWQGRRVLSVAVKNFIYL